MVLRNETLITGASEVNWKFRLGIILVLFILPKVCFAGIDFSCEQTPPLDRRQTPKPESDQIVKTNRPPVTAKEEEPPLTPRERAMLELIRDLQERVAKLEGKSTDAQRTAVENVAVVATTVSEPLENGKSASPSKPEVAAPASETSAATGHGQTKAREGWGTYTPNLGYKVADTPYGDLNISIYTYVRYLNQLGLNDSYTDAFGTIKSVQRRQDIQLQKVQIKFLGWVLSEKFRYFIYAWTSNANQGLDAQVVLAGNLNYTFNKHLTVSGGIRSLPGTRSVEGNFPFWLGVDSRMIADEYFRPSYTSGFWATGDITDKLSYHVMVGNNMSTLGVSASQLDNGLNTFSSAIIWEPTGKFGQGWGDFDRHDKLATRFAVHFNRSTETKESQPNSETVENTQLRLSDGSIIFTPNLFGPGISVTQAEWDMSSFDAGVKYRGYSLEAEYYLRALRRFEGPGTETLKNVYDHGFQLQAAAMFVPKTLQAYAGHSRVFGKYGNPYDIRFGVNWFPYDNKVIRWNTEALYLFKSPVGYTSVPFAVGGRGWVFHTSFELAF